MQKFLTTAIFLAMLLEDTTLAVLSRYTAIPLVFVVLWIAVISMVLARIINVGMSKMRKTD